MLDEPQPRVAGRWAPCAPSRGRWPGRGRAVIDNLAANCAPLASDERQAEEQSFLRRKASLAAVKFAKVGTCTSNGLLQCVCPRRDARVGVAVVDDDPPRELRRELTVKVHHRLGARRCIPVACGVR